MRYIVPLVNRRALFEFSTSGRKHFCIVCRLRRPDLRVPVSPDCQAVPRLSSHSKRGAVVHNVLALSCEPTRTAFRFETDDRRCRDSHFWLMKGQDIASRNGCDVFPLVNKFDMP